MAYGLWPMLYALCPLAYGLAYGLWLMLSGRTSGIGIGVSLTIAQFRVAENGRDRNLKLKIWV